MPTGLHPAETLARQTDFYLDRFEGNTAVLLAGGREINIPRDFLPDGASEGDHLVVSITRDDERRNATAGEISRLQERLKSDNSPNGQ